MDDKKLAKQAEKERKAAEKAARDEQRQKEKTARDLRRTISSYTREQIKEPEMAQEFAKAVTQFWNGHYTIETADEMDMNEAFRFFDWFTFDYALPDGERLIERFATEMRDEITVYQQEILNEWLDAPASSVYIYEGFDGFSQQFKLRDFFNEEETYIVFSGAGSGRAKPEDLIMARLVPVGERLEFSTVAAYIPRAEVGDLMEQLTAARHEGEEHETFMRRAGNLIIVHHALAQAEANDRYPVVRLDPKRVDKAIQRTAKKVVMKVRRK
ncbi:MAG: hypothetical protein OT477_20075 [Chloroflexi bacterium]|nr:hypothetical protein [Chloroflexota bacterium]